jgi:hypothetical protein
MTAELDGTPAIAISYDHQVSDGRIIRFHTGCAADASQSEINGLLDKLTASTDRQAAKYELEKLAVSIAREEKLFVQQTEDMARLTLEAEAEHLASKRKGPLTLRGAQIKDRENAEISIARRRDMIKAARDEAIRLKAVVDASHGAANSH